MAKTPAVAKIPTLTYTKFHANILIDAQIMAKKRNQNGGRRHLAFFSLTILAYCRLYTIAVNHHTKFLHCTKTNLQKCWSMPELWPKNEIQNGGRSHLEFNSGGYFWHIADFPLLISTTTQNLVPISQSAADLRQLFKIQDGGRPPSWIFENANSDR